MRSRGGTDEAVLFSSYQYAPKHLLCDSALWAGVHLTDVAQRLRAEFPEGAMVDGDHICRGVGLFHVGRGEAAMGGADLWLRDNEKRLG
eukprot:11524691-Alexandrium_andersonii.AAC.1